MCIRITSYNVCYTKLLRLKKGDTLKFAASGQTFVAQEVGILSPSEVPTHLLEAGEIGYVVTGIKEPGVASVGDTLMPERMNLSYNFV